MEAKLALVGCDEGAVGSLEAEAALKPRNSNHWKLSLHWWDAMRGRLAAWREKQHWNEESLNVGIKD